MAAKIVTSVIGDSLILGQNVAFDTVNPWQDPPLAVLIVERRNLPEQGSPLTSQLGCRPWCCSVSDLINLINWKFRCQLNLRIFMKHLIPSCMNAADWVHPNLQSRAGHNYHPPSFICVRKSIKVASLHAYWLLTACGASGPQNIGEKLLVCVWGRALQVAGARESIKLIRGCITKIYANTRGPQLKIGRWWR